MPAPRLGIWPSPPPFAPGAAVYLWTDGGLACGVVAAWLKGSGVAFTALVPTGLSEARTVAATLQAVRHGMPMQPFNAPNGPPTLAGLAAAAEGAAGGWLVLPEEGSDRPWALCLADYELALARAGLDGLWAPLLGLGPEAVGRLAMALGVPFGETVDCAAPAGAPCGECPPCIARARLLRRIGLAG